MRPAQVDIKRKITVKNGDNFESIELGVVVQLDEGDTATAATEVADGLVCEYIVEAMNGKIDLTVSASGANILSTTAPAIQASPAPAPNPFIPDNVPSVAAPVHAPPAAPLYTPSDYNDTQHEVSLPRRVKNIMAVAGTKFIVVRGQRYEMVDQRPSKNMNAAMSGNDGISDRAPDFVSVTGSADPTNLDQNNRPRFKYDAVLWVADKDGRPKAAEMAACAAATADPEGNVPSPVVFIDPNNPRRTV